MERRRVGRGRIARWIAVATMAALASPARTELTCAVENGTLAVGALQRARAIMASPQHRTAFARADCAKDMANSVEQAGPGPSGCPDACLREEVNLYKDAAIFMRKAYDAARSADNKKAFAQREVDVRLKLHELLKNDAKSTDPGGAELRRNFSDLADAYELLNDARTYHQMISSDDTRTTLGPKAFEIWAKAVRSCSAWDFTSGSNRDVPQLLRELCGASCRPEVEKLEATLVNVTSPEARAKVENLVPATTKCPAVP